jgi:flagellar basal body rod protein FlgG
VNLSLYENASALRGLEQYQNIIANNLAASHVAGFKKAIVSFEAIEGGEIPRSTHNKLTNTMPGSFPLLKNQSDLHEGALRETNNPLDLALRGNGFFALNNAKGESVYTRNGQFYINSEGVLVNSMGHEFSDLGGNAIETTPGSGEVSVDKEGQVFQGTDLIGEIGVFTFDDPLKQLQRIGGGFIPKDETVVPQEAEPGTFTILQGFLEDSNVSPIEEMIGLIEVSRAHEANQKMIQTFDQNVGKAIGTLGQTT